MLRSFVVFPAVLALAAGLGVARASEAEGPLPVRLTFAGPPACGHAAAFLARLRARSARIREAAPGETAPAIDVALRRDGTHVEGVLTMASDQRPPAPGAGGRREIRGSDCESVTEGLALIAAVILDPSLTFAGASAPPAAPAVTAAPPPPERPSSSPAPSIPLRLSLGGAFEAGLGQGPDPLIEPRLYVDLALPSPVARASARLSVGRSDPQSVGTAVGVAQISLVDVRLEPCFEFASPGPLRLHACGIVEGGAMSGRGTTTGTSLSQTRALFELGLGLRTAWAIGDRVALGLLVAGTGALEHYRFYFQSPDTTAYRLSAWSAFAEIALGVRLL